jgi:phosphoribosyl 1,2-cyclic phosphate phosphodiesterase
MQLAFLGTSAANAFPEAFCSCPNCLQARSLGGPSLRRRASVLVDDALLIDLGPDLHPACQAMGLSLANVRWCLQTHAHADHLDPSHFLSRSPGYGVTAAPRLHFYASQASLQEAARLLERDFGPAGFLAPATGDLLNLELHPVESFQTFQAGPYRVTAFPANHDPSVEPLLYAFEAAGRTIFYGTDTAALAEETWQAFHRLGLRFDLAILDHTYGPHQPGSDHLSARDVIEHTRRLREEKLLAPDGRVIATHIAHEGNPAHPELAEFAALNGYEVAWDGLIV